MFRRRSEIERLAELAEAGEPPAGLEAGAKPGDRSWVVAFTVAALGATALVLGLEESDAVKDPVQKAARGEVTGLSRYSMLRRESFARALRQAERRAGPGALLTGLTLRPTEADFDVLTAKGGRSIAVDPGFGVEEDDGPGAGTGVDFDALDAAAPERLVANVRRRFGEPPDEVSFVALFGLSGAEVEWLANYRATRADEHRYEAAGDGSQVRLTYSPELELRERRRAIREQARRRREAERAHREAERARRQAERRFQAARRRSACLQRAFRKGGDRDAIASCLKIR